MFRFAFGPAEQVVIVAAQRSRYSIDRDPYPGNRLQIRQDLRPSTSITEYWDAPRLGRRQACVLVGGLAALKTARAGDSLFGFNRFLADV